MTTQDTYTEKISSWLDNELTEAEAIDLQHHLQQCQTCQVAYQQLKLVDGWLRSAAQIMVDPVPGFTGRFETRLARYQPQKLWHIWLAVAGLALGALFILSVTVLFGGVTIYNLGTSIPVPNGQLAFNALLYIINSADNVRFILDLGLLFLKTSLITMQTPIFWGLAVIAAALALMWVRVMRSLLKNGMVATAKLMF